MQVTPELMAEMTPVMMTYKKMMSSIGDEAKAKMAADNEAGKTTNMLQESFTKADLDKDGLLNEAEYTAFFAIQKEAQVAAYGEGFTYTAEDVKMVYEGTNKLNPATVGISMEDMN